MARKLDSEHETTLLEILGGCAPSEAKLDERILSLFDQDKEKGVEPAPELNALVAGSVLQTSRGKR